MMTKPTGRLTQGQFSFLPDLTDEEIAQQVQYGLDKGYAWSVEYTDDPHPRNAYWEMWNLPLFDLRADQADVAMREVKACRESFPNYYVKVIAYDHGLRGSQSRESMRLGERLVEWCVREYYTVDHPPVEGID